MGHYFRGWYIKLQSESRTLALIVACSRTGREGSVCLQVITDDFTGAAEYGISEYTTRKKGFDITLGANRFSEDGLHLDVHRQGHELSGDVSFGPWKAIGGDIMGPFHFVPFMQCRHEILSAYHDINGELTLNGIRYDLNGARGYIEGDRGYSFPSVYLWTQCLFDGGSLFLSVADIPFGLFHFTGLIGFVCLGGKEYRLATYKGGKATDIKDGGCIIRQGDITFTVQLLHKNDHPLQVPMNGSMARTIRESASCTARYSLTIHGETLLDLTTNKASFEFEF